jgi:ABC-type branched-subunit amino acid transport system ATPase component
LSPLLDIAELSVSYSGLRALDDVSMHVNEGAVVGLIGPNGAGKTTLIDAVTGFTNTVSGRISLRGDRIDQLPPHQRARRGLARTFQTAELFDDLTVAENLQAAADRPSLAKLLVDAVRPGLPRDDLLGWALDLAGVPSLRDRSPRELSTGERTLVGVARAIVTKPHMLLLDEPAAGLGTAESQQLGQRLRSVADAGITVLLVDHDVSLILNVCDWIYVLEFGAIIASGLPDEVRTNSRVISAYLGSTAESASTAIEPALGLSADDQP